MALKRHSRRATPGLILALLWLVGINLRTVILAVPPTLPALHHALALSYSAGGLLTSLPVLIMAVGAIPGAYLVSRVGARQAITYGLALLTVGAALRGVYPSVAALFIFTIVLSLGIAVSQPAVPSLVQAWLPDRIGRGIAIYTNGIFVGEVIAATVTLPFLVNPFGWQGALAAWALPVGAALALWLAFTPSTKTSAQIGAAWFPDWRSGRMLRIGLLMGGASIVYFGMNVWIPDTLDARHAHNLIPLTLGVLNAMQLPVSLALALAADAIVGRRWPFVLAGLAAGLGVAGYILAPVETAPIWAGLAGAGASIGFILSLGLPALLSPTEVARTTGLMLTIGYGAAFFGPSLGGVAWDVTGHFLFALLPMALGAVAMVGFGATLPRLSVSRPVRPAESAAVP
jgi:CP family cyanate transporter-like MFS transporter